MKIIRHLWMPQLVGPDIKETKTQDVHVKPCPVWCTSHNLVTDYRDRVVRLAHHAEGAFWSIQCSDDLSHTGRAAVRSEPKITPAFDDLLPADAAVLREIARELDDLAAVVSGA